MTDQKDAAFVFFESTFQSLFCIHIQMVGGLIQEQDIGVTVDQLAKPYLGLFSTAQDVDFGIPVRSDTWRRERFFLTMMFSNNIFMGIVFPNWRKILWKIKEKSSERGIL